MTTRVLLMAGSLESGGSERQTLLLLRHLDRSRFAPELYLTYRRGEWLSQVPEDVPVHAFIDDPDGDHSREDRLNWPGRIHGRMVRHLRELLRRRQIQAVYDRTFHMTLVAGPATRCRSWGSSPSVPRVSVIVSPPEWDLPHSESRFLSLKQWRLAAAYRQAHRVLAVSEAVRQSSMRYYGLGEAQVAVLHSPLDLHELRAQAAEPLPMPPHTEPLGAEDFNIVCIGRMTREKGHDLLIEALRQIAEAHAGGTGAGGGRAIVVWMLGEGPERERLEAQAAGAGLGAQIRFVGRQIPAAPWLARCDLLVCPSRYEGLPNVILEAFALGVPVLASEVGGVGEIVREGETGYLIPSENPSALAAAILSRVGDTAGNAEMVARAGRLVETDFSLARYLPRVEEYLSEAASGRQPGS